MLYGWAMPCGKQRIVAQNYGLYLDVRYGEQTIEEKTTDDANIIWQNLLSIFNRPEGNNRKTYSLFQVVVKISVSVLHDLITLPSGLRKIKSALEPLTVTSINAYSLAHTRYFQAKYIVAIVGFANPPQII